MLLHRLSNVNPTTRTADCAICGPNAAIRSKGTKRWRCRYRHDNRPRAKCHPSRPNLSLDLCASCYQKQHRQKELAVARQRKKDWVSRNHEQHRASANAWTANNSARMRTFHLRHLYGITAEQFGELLTAQGGRCAICGTTDPGSRFKYMTIDHDHESGRIRGLLCFRCNCALGIFGDSEELLLKALEYVRRDNR